MPLKPTRFELEVDIDPAPAFKSTARAIIAAGSLLVEVKPGEPPVPVWSFEMGPLIVRQAAEADTVRAAMVAALRKIADELERG